MYYDLHGTKETVYDINIIIMTNEINSFVSVLNSQPVWQPVIVQHSTNTLIVETISRQDHFRVSEDMSRGALQVKKLISS